MKRNPCQLLKDVFVYKYSLPHGSINRTNISTMDDQCYATLSDDKLTKLIYDGIAFYSLGEKNVNLKKMDSIRRQAILSRLRYDKNAPEETKLNYGFYGEVVLDIVLQAIFKSYV